MTYNPPSLDDEDDVVKEMYDGEYNRVDIVAGPASGLRFVVLKTGDPATPENIARAQALGAPMTTTTPAPVVKAADDPLPDGDDLMSDATPGAAGSEVPTDAPGDPDEPSSPAWEAVDAARARAAVNMVIGLQRMVNMSLGRETQEAAVGADPEDCENAYDLSNVLDCLDCILDTLAPFAVGEQAEAEDRETDATTMVTKAGRILSGTNENLIRQAQASLSQVLASLPEATVPEGDTVTKSETPAAAAAPEAIVDPLEPVAPVAKAAEDGLLAVYSQGGKLLGAVDPTKLTTLTTGDEGTDTDDPTKPGDDDTPATPTDPAAPPAEAAAPPAAPAPVAPPVAKQLDTTEDPTEVLKSVLAGVVKEALSGFEDRVAKMEAQPAFGGPMLHGATGNPGLYLRGQNDVSGDADIDRVRKQMDEATIPAVRAQLNRQLVAMQLSRGVYGPPA